MVVKVGDSLPTTDLYESSPEDKTSLPKVFGTKKGVLFGVPGAFSPGCSKSHLPGYVTDYDKLKSAGAEIVVCVTVNDAFVANAWGEQHGTKGKVTVLADPKGDLAKAMGVTLDGEGILAAFGTARGKRFSAVIEGGKFKTLNIEPDGKGMTCSVSSEIVSQLK